jgi:hypothetical protein
MAKSFLGRRLLAAARLARWEREVEAAVGRALARRKTQVMTAGALTAAGDDFGADEWDTDVEEEVRPVVEAIMEELAGGVVATFPLTGDDAARVLGRIDASSTIDEFVRLVRGIGPDTARRIHAALAEGVGSGESIPQIAERVESVFALAMRRATTIARTETNRAANAGLNAAAGEVAKELAITKTWLAALDDRTRDDHADADGQTVAYDEPFDIGGESAMYPCDPDLSAEQSINCRCVLTFDVADESDPEAQAALEAAEAEADAG